jgi:hypothetical protein
MSGQRTRKRHDPTNLFHQSQPTQGVKIPHLHSLHQEHSESNE